MKQRNKVGGVMEQKPRKWGGNQIDLSEKSSSKAQGKFTEGFYSICDMAASLIDSMKCILLMLISHQPTVSFSC